MRLFRSLPPGAKPYKVAEALGLLDPGKLEDRLTARLWRLRQTGGRRGQPMSIRQVSEYLTAHGEPTSTGWLHAVYTATKPHDPAA